MGSLSHFLFIYVLGGITFVPLLLGSVVLLIYYTSPNVTKDALKSKLKDPASLLRKEDGQDDKERLVFKTGTDDLAEKFNRKHDSDVAAGYFAVCRDYVPGGVNGKPPERLSPAGEVVAQESPSVYQSMYRSIFDRSQKPTIEPNKDTNGRNVKKANNVFYVVLRHGHLMLYDDIQQLEVRYVISLEYHDVDVYAGEGEEIPEAELWMKRNAIRLRRKTVQVGDKAVSLPFFFFSENLSEKEDFYHAIIRNQEKSNSNLPVPQEFEIPHIIALVQKLHSNEEQLQTRWFNALLGRLFLAMYKTPHLEQIVRQKLTKKISRVKKPNFITRLALQKIDMGESAPFITNPRLKDLTVNGDCIVEVDLNYTGQCRVEIAATARIDLGSRFKAREVDMVLAATCKRLQGHMLLRIKPPPSNRLWITFEKMPKIEMTLEPVVSTRQITYTVILKAIESRILEVIAETIVLPFWDDMPFLDTAREIFRGGIWKKEPAAATSTEIKDEAPEDEAEAGGEGTKSTLESLKKDERMMSMPVLTDKKDISTVKAAKKSVSSLKEVLGTHGLDKSPVLPPRSEPPKALRSTSFASASNPAISPTHAGGDTLIWDIKAGQRRDSMLKDISSKTSLGTSPESVTTGSLPTESAMANPMRDRTSSNTSKSSIEEAASALERRASIESQETVSSRVSGSVFPLPRTETAETMASGMSRDSSRSRASTHEGHHHQFGNKDFVAAAKSLTTGDRKQAIASVSAAASAAQKWGWGVIARNRQREADGQAAKEVPSVAPINEPMGRGQPLPPPGTPLPPPAKPSLFSMPKRKPGPVPPPLPKRSSDSESTPETGSGSGSGSPRLPPALPDRPERKRRQASLAQNTSEEQADELLVVAAPAESTPATPLNEHHDEFFGHSEDAGEVTGGTANDDLKLPLEKPALPSRKEPFQTANVEADVQEKLRPNSGDLHATKEVS